MRILMLTQWFDPEPIFKGLTFAKELVRQGHEVEVLTGFPNYPDGKLYPGYRVKLLQREVIDGIHIIRVPLYPNHDKSSIKRFLNCASFSISVALMGWLLVKRADVLYVFHPPGTVALPAIVLKFLRGIPFVYDIQDLWPDTLSAIGMLNNRALLKGVNYWCSLTYKMADHVVVLSPGLKRKLMERGVSAEKISVIYNWCDEIRILSTKQSEAENRETMMAGRFNIVFAGNMGEAQAIDAVLDAASIIGGKLPHIQFVFIGGGTSVERLKGIKKLRRLENVLFLPHRPISEIGSVLSMADVLFVHLRDDPLFEITIPSKTQAYLAIGRPILMAVRGDASELVERAFAGVTCEPENAKAIAAAVEMLATMPREQLDEMGNNGKRFYHQELSLRAGSRHFEQVFKAVAGLS